MQEHLVPDFGCCQASCPCGNQCNICCIVLAMRGACSSTGIESDPRSLGLMVIGNLESVDKICDVFPLRLPSVVTILDIWQIILLNETVHESCQRVEHRLGGIGYRDGLNFVGGSGKALRHFLN